MLVERLELTCGNLVLLERVRRGEKGAHVLDERLGYAGRQLDRLTGHGLKIGSLQNKRPQRVGRRGRQPLARRPSLPDGWGFGAFDRER